MGVLAAGQVGQVGSGGVLAAGQVGQVGSGGAHAGSGGAHAGSGSAHAGSGGAHAGSGGAHAGCRPSRPIRTRHTVGPASSTSQVNRPSCSASNW